MPDLRRSWHGDRSRISRRERYRPLFVVLRDSLALDAAMKHKINRAIDVSVPRRFLPNKICAVPEIPRALSGEGQVLPIEKLLLDQPIENVVNEDATANPARLDWWVAFAGKFRQS